MRLAARSDLRFVESGDDLIRLLLESLSRFQADLQGELRTVVGLWNESTTGNDPKGENHLANAIALHLRQDLAGRQIIIGRELILQVGILGAAGGLRTDIDVVAIGKKDPHRSIDRVRAVIEVKGSWNPSVNTALSTQLVQQYMKPHGIQNGLYVVGYYTCDSWKQGAKSSRSKSLGTKEKLETILEMQAVQHSNALHRVRAVVLDTSLPSQPAESGV
jgi:hypothetical protein